MHNVESMFGNFSTFCMKELNQYQHEPAQPQCSHGIETRQLIYTASQLTGFYVMKILPLK